MPVASYRPSPISNLTHLIPGQADLPPFSGILVPNLAFGCGSQPQLFFHPRESADRMSSSVQDAEEAPTKPCHNCRRRRLKCDRSTPTCQKCAKTGQECLGYGKLFLWNQGVASRGKMMGKSYPAQAPPSPRRSGCAAPADSGTGSRQHDWRASQVVARRSSSHAVSAGSGISPLQPSLVDPLFQDLGPSSRLYLSHCKISQCG